MDIQKEQYQCDQKEFDYFGLESMHRQLAVKLIRNMPLAMLKRILPMTKRTRNGVVTLKIQLEG